MTECSRCNGTGKIREESGSAYGGSDIYPCPSCATNTPKAAPVRAKDWKEQIVEEHARFIERWIAAVAVDGSLSGQAAHECRLRVREVVSNTITAAENDRTSAADASEGESDLAHALRLTRNGSMPKRLPGCDPGDLLVGASKYVQDGDAPLVEYAKRVAADIDEHERDDRQLVAWATLKHWRTLLRRGLEAALSHAAVTVAGGEPVAWQYLGISNDDSKTPTWKDCADPRGAKDAGYEVRPLFANPNPVQPEGAAEAVTVAELRQRLDRMGRWQQEVVGYLIVANKLRPDYYESPIATVRDLIEHARSEGAAAATRGGEES